MSLLCFFNMAILHRITSRKCIHLNSRVILNLCMVKRNSTTSIGNSTNNWTNYMTFIDGPDPEVIKDMIVIEDFLNENEEKSLFDEVEPYLKRLHYEFDHWDDAIHGFRETERLQWNVPNTSILQRVRDIAFPPGTPTLSLVHVLDLAEKGFIKPHIDSSRFCGNTIAGLSLLSNCVMRLTHDNEKTKSIEILLKRRSLYIMKGLARYDYTHEILGNDHSSFKGEVIVKDRRISIICRNEPTTTDG